MLDHLRAFLNTRLAKYDVKRFLRKSPRHARLRSLDLAQLEDRVMMSATPLAAALPVGAEATELTQSQLASVDDLVAHVQNHQGDPDEFQFVDERLAIRSPEMEGPEQTRIEVVLVDAGAGDYRQLVDDLLASADGRRQLEVYLLEGGRDGVEQIGEILAGYQDLDAVHLVSHGTEGQVKLGDSWLNIGNLDGYAGQIASWNYSLRDDADLLIYGCGLAANQDGQSLIEALGALCDCDVAASDDDTGHTSLGGDWDLEYQAGVIETDLAFSTDARQGWLGLLSATPTGGVINVSETPNGDEQTTVNAAPKAIASDANGDFVAVWESDRQDGSNSGIYARRFNSDGSAKAGEFPVNTTTTGDQLNPAVAVNANGQFVVVFQTKEAPGSDKMDIYAVLYDNTGGVVKSEFLVNTYQSEDQTDPSVAMRDDGSFMVTWTSKDQDGDKEGIFAQIFDAAGDPSGGVIQVNNVAPKEQLYSSVATNSAGEFVVTWSSKSISTNKFSIAARRFNSNGAALGKQFTVDQFGGTDQLYSDVDLADDGSFVIAWQSTNQDAGTHGIYARRYDSSGNPLDNEFLVNQSTGAADELAPSISIDAAGNVVITWTTDDSEVYAREFDALGNPSSGDIHVTTLLNDQFGGVVSVAETGDYVVLFSGEGPGDSDGVFAQRYMVPDLPVVDVNGGAAGVDFSTSLVEDGGAVSIVDPASTITDTDSTQLEKLSVIITNVLDGVDESLIADTSGTSLMANYLDGVLTISGAGATNLSEFITVLQTLQYDNTSQAPVTTDRVIRFVAQDTSLFSGPSALTTVSIQAINDQPSILAPATDVTDEDVPLIFSPSNGNAVSISDDAGESAIEVTLAATNGTFTVTNRLGNEERVHAAVAGDQKAPAVAVAADGRYVVVWHKKNGIDGDDVYARTYNADGTAISGDIIVPNNTGKHQRNAVVAIDDNGDFVVVYEHDTENINDKWDVYARTFDINGNPLGGSATRVNDTKLDDQLAPSVTMGNDGTFVVAWQSKTAASGKEIYLRAFDLELNDLTPGDILVNSTPSSDQTAPDIAMRSDGQFVVVWQSKDQDGSGEGIYLKRFDAAYAAIDGADVVVNATHTANHQKAPAVALNDNDQVVVVWQGEKQDDPDDSYGVFAQRVDFTAGSLVGSEISVNSETADHQAAPDVALGDDGKFVVVWQSHGQEADDNSKGIYLQELNADGTKLRFEELVNTETLDDQHSPAIGMKDSSQYVVVWQSKDQDTTNDDGIYAQRFLRPGALDFTDGDGIEDVTATFTGRVADVNQALDGMSFKSNQDYNGPASLQLDVDDLGNTGAGLPEQDSHTINLTINAVNDAPVLSAPQSTQQVPENQPFTFDTASSNTVSLSDVDAADLEVILSVSNGILKIDTGTGVTITGGANDTASVTFTGTQSQLNDALDGLVYTPNITYLGPDTLNITVDDQGNSGSGGPLLAADSVAINVFDFNLPPVNSYPASVSTPESTTFIFSGVDKIEVIDNDALGSDHIDVRLTVTHGQLKLTSNPGIAISGNWAAGDTQLIVNGDKDLVNDALDGLIFEPDANYAGVAYLQITTNDQGNSGIDGDKSDLDIVEINVTPDVTNDAPTVSGPATAVTNEETPITFTSATGNALQVNDDANGNPIRVTITGSDGTVSLSNTAGTQFQVNTTTDKDQHQAAVAMNVSGDFVVVWESHDQDGDEEGIYAQRYDASGLPIDSDFKVNATTHKSQTDPAVAISDDGSFVITWVSEDQDANSKGIFAQRYDAHGARLGGEFQVNTFSNKAQQSPDVAMDASGRFVIVWESDDQDGDDWGIYGQVFDSAGNTVGSEFRVNFETDKDQRAPSVAMDIDGDFAVTWQSKQPGTDKWDILARRFDASGIAKDAGDIIVNSVVDEQQEAPDVAMDAAGNFVIAWQSKDLDYPDGKFGVFHRRFAANGTAATAQQVLVNTQVVNEQNAPSVAMDRSGEYVVSWQSKRQDDPSQDDKFGVFAKRFNANGSNREGEFQVNTTTNKNQQDPAVAIGDDGRFIIVWESESEDGDGYGVFAQHYKDVANLTFVQGDGTDDAVMQFEGTIDEINDALDGLVYTPAVDFDFDTSGLTSLQIDVDDLGNTGSGGGQLGGHTVNITVNPFNDAPTFSLPSPQTAYEEVPLVFSTANGNLISIADVDSASDPIQLSLTSYGGTMTLAGTAGLTLNAGDGIDDNLMTFTGTLTDINAALDGIRYTAPADSAGQGNIQFSADDLGNNGAGGSKTNNAVVLIDIEQDFVNDPPRVNVPGPQQTAKNVALRISDLDGNQLTIDDDSVDNPIRVQLNVTAGSVTLTNTVGAETQVNTRTADEQRFSNIATTPSGDFIVVWQGKNQDGSGEGVFAQRFNAAGSKIGPEFQVNQFTASHQTAPVVAVNSSGQFAIAWESDGQDGSNLGVFTRKYDSIGNPLGDETRVNTGTIGDQKMPSIAMDASGAFVVAWQGVGDGADIYAQRFDTNGVAQGTQIVVNITTAGNQEEPAVAMDAAGNFVIAWKADDANGKGIFAQRFDAAGNKIGTPGFQVNTIEDGGDEQLPAIAINAAGQFIIAWQGDDTNNVGIRATFYDSDASFIREDFIVNEDQVGNQEQPSVALNDSGQFIVAWHSDAAGTKDIVGRLFDAAGTPFGGDFAVNSTMTNDQTNPSVAIDEYGSPLITWTSHGNQDGDAEGVYLQRTIPAGAVTFHAGTGENDTFVDIEGRPEFINGMLNGMVFTPDSNFMGEASIDISVDDQGNTGAGGPYIDNDTVTIMVDAPSLDLDTDDRSGSDGANYLTHFTPGGAAVNVIDVDKLIATPENDLKSFTITLTNRPDGANETLTADTSAFPAISHFYDSGTGVLSITGQDSKLNYAAVLDTIQYNNLAGSPNEDPRIITVQFRDKANDDSNLATTTVLIDMRPPLLDVIGELDYTEFDPPSLVVSSASVSDLDTSNFTGGKLTIDMASSGSINDRLAIRDQGTGVGQISIVGLDVQYNFGGGPVTVGSFAAAGPYDGLTTIEINLNASSDANSVEAIIKNVTFENVSSNPAPSLRAVRFVLDDGEGGISETANATVRVTVTSDVILDQFNAVAYDGDDGTISWSNDWQEIGEGNGPNGGQVRVTTLLGERGLQIQQSGKGAVRQVDLSGATTAILSFDYARFDLDDASDFIVLEASGNGGAAWSELDRFEGPADDAVLQSSSYDISGYIAADTQIRFVSSGMSSSDSLFVDNVQIALSNDVVSQLSKTAEFLVNSMTADDQETSGESRGSTQAVALAPSGDYVVVWTSDGQDSGSSDGVYAQRFDATGTAQGPEFRVNETAADDQRWATVASDASGNFVVAWTSDNQDGSSRGVYARLYNAAGVAQTGEFLVNTTTNSAQDSPSVAMNADGDFVVVWEGNGSGDSSGVFAQRFNAAGVEQGGEILVNSETPGTQSEPAVAMDSAGNFVVVWDDADGFHGRRFSTLGVAQGPQFTIDGSSTSGNGDVAMDPDGDFVAVWRETYSGRAVLAQRYDSAGTPGGSQFVVNMTVPNDQTHPSVDMDANGNFVVVWEGNGLGDDDGVFWRQYDAAGTPQNDELRVNQTLPGTQHMASVAMIGLDNFVVVFSGNGPGDSSGVFARQYHGTNNAPTFTSSATPSVTEDSTAAVTVTTADVDGDASTFSISGGSDQALFTIDPWTGELTFDAAPDFESPGDIDGNNVYEVEVTANDGSGATVMQAISVTVNNVNEAPTISNLAADTLAYSTAAGPRVIEQGDDALVADLDSANFAGGSLRVSIPVGGTPLEDVLSIRNQGTNPGEIGFFGGNVTFGGTTIGSAIGGTLGADLVVNLNSNATPAAVTALIRNITYENLNNVSPTMGPRTIRFTIDDGDGATSLAHDTFVNVNATNDPPTVTSATFNIDENSSNGASVGTVAASDPDAGQMLTYSITGGSGATAFAINSSSGEITIADAAQLDFETTGSFTLDVRVTDNGGPNLSDTATMTINLNPQNDNVPTAVGDAITVVEGATATSLGGGAASVLANDTDADLPGDTLSALLDSGPSLAAAFVLNADGTFSYTHDGSENFSDSFTYHVFDGANNSATVIVTINVTPSNDDPKAVADVYVVNEDSSLNVVAGMGVLANDSDTDLPGDTLSATVVTGPAHGSLTLNTDGSFTYAAHANFHGSDSFTYQVHDGSGGVDLATVTIEVKVLGGAIILPPSVEPPPAPPADVPPPPDDSSEDEDDSLFAINLPNVESSSSGSSTARNQSNKLVHLLQHGQVSSGFAIAEEEQTESMFAFQSSVRTNRAVREMLSPETLEALQRFVIPFDVSLLANDLQEMTKELNEDTNFAQVMAGSAVGISGALTVGYVLWTIRGGWLLTSLLAQMPAWRMVDPLVVLNYLDEESNTSSDDEDESLEEMLEQANDGEGAEY